jgi:hypothetical protein
MKKARSDGLATTYSAEREKAEQLLFQPDGHGASFGASAIIARFRLARTRKDVVKITFWRIWQCTPLPSVICWRLFA